MLTAINNQQQSFGAKLNIKNINMPHKEEISKEFAKITKHYKEIKTKVINNEMKSLDEMIYGMLEASI